MPGEELTQEEFEALARAEAERAFDARIIEALERVPEPAVPDDFAARVSAMVPAKKAPAVRRFATVRSTRYGQIAMWVALVVLLVLVGFVSRGSERSVLAMTVEALLFVEFAAVAAWLGLRRWREG